MTTRTTPFAPGTPCWVDLLSTDPDTSSAFYAALLGWTAQAGSAEFGGYVTFSSGGHAVAGMVRNQPATGAPDGWSTYLSTADADATVAAAAGLGGTVLSAVMAVAGLGRMALLTDPAGATFGLWESGTRTGFEKYNEPGSVTWDEHHSTDFASTTPFYEQLLGWKLDRTNDSDEFRYYQAYVGDEVVAGLMDSAGFLPPGVPSHWAVYFSVADVDASVATALASGGTVVRPAEDTPFGRIADLTDPTGASFRLHGPTLTGDGTGGG